MTTPVIPPDPLTRFLEIADAVEARRRWWQGATYLRYAAMTLATIEGSARRVADELVATAEELKRRAGWFGSLNSDVRFVVAAMLVRAGQSAGRFHEAMERGRAMFRRVGLGRGHVHEVLAALLVWLGRDHQAIREADARRLKDTLAAMKEHHPWLTGANDYPACALLTLRDESIHRQMHRIERFYRDLRAGGLPIGDALQMLSHLLYFNPAPDDVVVRRFFALRERFKQQSVAMWTSDHDELALLTFVDRPAHTVVDTVLRHRAEMRKLRPRPDASLSFSLACGTAFLELLGQAVPGTIRDAQALAQIQQILAAQQAAVIAACSGAVVASTASH